MSPSIHVSLERRFLRDSVCLYLFERRPNQGTAIALPIVFQEIDLNSLPADPSIEISNETAQSLFDELYRIGYRPKEEGTAGQLAATVAHLNDQRALSSKLLALLERKIFEPPAVVYSGTLEEREEK